MAATLHLHADDAADMERAAGILRAGGLVAFPTETVYGLGANALSAEAVAGIFAAKRRPHWDPLIVHIESAEEIGRVADAGGDLRERAEALANAFWPGPLTLLLPRVAAIADVVTAGRATVGVRVPAHWVARSLLRMAGVPVAAPSANRFGHVSPTCAQHVLDDLGGRIDAVLDGGATQVGVESAVLDPAPTPMVLYRSGAVTAGMIERATGVAVQAYSRSATVGEAPESLPSPGVGMRHYAPDAEVILTGASAQALRRAITGRADGARCTGVLLPRDWAATGMEDLVVEPWGRWDDPESLASGVFAALRALEAKGASRIYCPLPDAGGLLDAVRDRLLKAARPR